MSDNDDIIDMKEAIALLNTSQPTFYRWLREGRVKGHKVGRQWRFQREDIEALARGEAPAAEQPGDLAAVRGIVSKRLEACGGEVEVATDDDPIRGLAMLSLHLAMRSRASDLHLEATEGGGRMRIRIDGEMHAVADYSAELQRQLVDCFKGLHHCNVQIKDRPQDGRMRLDHEGQQLDCRLTSIPTYFGEDLVLRMLVPEQGMVDLDRIGLPDDQRELVDQALASSHGLILASGPTGSGKTTTLYALLNQLNQPGRKLISIEEPVEYTLPGVQQIQARDNSLPAGHALRAALRCAPDVLMMSELTSRDQVHEICEAAIAGHLVLSQLHCDSCISAIERLRDVGVPAPVIGDALRLVIAQRLVRRLCPHCAEAIALPAEEHTLVERICRDNAIDPGDLPDGWKQAKGCSECNNTGYRGRLAVNEVLAGSSELRRAIMAEASAEELRDIQLAEGQYDLRGQALLRAARGETTLFELRRLLAV